MSKNLGFDHSKAEKYKLVEKDYQTIVNVLNNYQEIDLAHVVLSLGRTIYKKAGMTFLKEHFIPLAETIYDVIQQQDIKNKLTDYFSTKSDDEIYDVILFNLAEPLTLNEYQDVIGKIK